MNFIKCSVCESESDNCYIFFHDKEKTRLIARSERHSRWLETSKSAKIITKKQYKKTKDNDMNRFECVKKVINDEDYMGLIKGLGAPDDEYSDEINEFLKRIRDDFTIKQMQRHLFIVFDDGFAYTVEYKEDPVTGEHVPGERRYLANGCGVSYHEFAIGAERIYNALNDREDGLWLKARMVFRKNKRIIRRAIRNMKRYITTRLNSK